MKLQHALLAGTLLAGSAGAVIAQNADTHDPNKLPAMQGTVAECSLTPRGDVDGLIFTDGSKVHLPPYPVTQLVCAVKSGDAVPVRGLRARAIPMVQASSIRNDAFGSTVIDNGLSGPGVPGGARDAQQPLTADGRIKA